MTDDKISENKTEENPESETELTGEAPGPESKFQEYFSDNVEEPGPKITETLLSFFSLKKIDEELFEIEQEKGDLPGDITSIKGKIGSNESDLKEKQEMFLKLEEEKSSLEKDNSSFEEKISKYDEQKFSVRNNVEYDDIVRAIDTLFEEVKKNEIRIEELVKNSATLQDDSGKLEAKLSELNSDLVEKQNLLDELNEQYKQDEQELKEKRAEQIAKLDEKSAAFYEKINSSFKGEATAIVRKGNCSGCYNSIPPQRVIEIKSAEKIFTCQSCGRILIPEDIVPNE